eukprot:GHUV01027513.1.p1 GENE.GHUV01027513.1~~GHUV01027513.1.p1  ORF type:complete len:236 (+),score=66.50 GHUV01027513.1:274-981(+)
MLLNIPLPFVPTLCLQKRRQSSLAAPQASQQAAASSSSTPIAAGDAASLKQQLRQSIEGINRGIFGVPAAKRQEVAAVVDSLEALNPLQQPTQHLDQVAGSWNLLYTTITITGVKKTKLGLREFIRLGDFQQQIDIDRKLALNVVQFNVAGLGALSGCFTVKASYEPVSDSRVDIKFIESTLVPDQLQQLFKQNYDLLLSIFNPEGWLEITYVDEELRVGRDDKGNIFVLERARR